LSSTLASRVPSPLLYGLAAAILLAEAVVFWLMLHPQVPEDFRAYYIDRTTTCLNQPVAGTYQFGTVQPMLPEARETIAPIKVCGWDGPAGDGLHAVGTHSRLRLVGEAAADIDSFVAELAAVRKNDAVVPQTVEVWLDGTLVESWMVDSAERARYAAPIPPEALADGRLEVELRFPQAVSMGVNSPDTQWRSVKLTAAGAVTGDQAAQFVATPPLMD
jgi:hypothetical protein